MPSHLLEDWRHRPTHRQVWALTAPMIASNLSVPLVSLVDSAVAGHLPYAAQLAAVAVGASVYTLLAWICGFLRMGTTGFAAQAHGRRAGDDLRRVLVQSLVLAALMAAVLLLIAWPLLPATLDVMNPSPDLRGLALGYLRVRLLALPADLANYALIGWFLGNQNARVALGVLLTTNFVNIVLNLLFVLGFGWGVAGIALASVVGAWCGTLFGLAWVRRELARHPGRMDWSGLRALRHWRTLLSVNRDIFVRSLALQGVFFALTVLGTRLGATVVAANALLLNGLLLVSFALDGLANAVEAMSGHAIGARDGTALRRALVVAGGWAILGSVAFAIAFWLGGRLFVDLQTNIAVVRAMAYAYLPWLAVLPLVGVWSYLLDGLFVGATRGREMRDAMLVSVACFALLAWVLRGLGNHGLWMAFLGFMVVRAGTMAWMAVRIRHRHDWIPPPAVAGAGDPT